MIKITLQIGDKSEQRINFIEGNGSFQFFFYFTILIFNSEVLQPFETSKNSFQYSLFE